ncbi:MAG: SDR family NAD(P)-dependent oxidoreductase [Planctomycetaceae bacterium]|nr:SDR family NAD(P)-dependent oxidoreductase [Planctomycetaceae bacterium]
MSHFRSSSRSSRVALVTGASSGLGAAIARELVARKKVSALVLTARRLDRLEALAGELKAADSSLTVQTIAVDLAAGQPDASRRLIDRVAACQGGLDLLYNNAGLGLPTLFADADADQIARQITVNLTAPLMLARFAIPLLAPRGGIIVNIGSAITCIPNSALGAYGATKAALAYWNDALRRELRSMGIRVCLVEPGPISTEFSHAFERLLPPGTRPHSVVETPRPWMVAQVEDVAGRVVGLIDHPRRRLSVRRRLVWPLRAVGSLLRLWPSLGDAVVTGFYGVDHAPRNGANGSYAVASNKTQETNARATSSAIPGKVIADESGDGT